MKNYIEKIKSYLQQQVDAHTIAEDQEWNILVGEKCIWLEYDVPTNVTLNTPRFYRHITKENCNDIKSLMEQLRVEFEEEHDKFHFQDILDIIDSK